MQNVASKSSVHILPIRSYHAKLASEKDLKPELIDADEFRGLRSHLNVCEGARVLLTQNEWVEAGLMNGAIGTVRGVVWPEGGDPHSQISGKQAPLCIVVEFDDVNLGEDVSIDAVGRRIATHRNFFPDLDLGIDDRGKPRSRKCVPIFRQGISASSDENVKRFQFPLVLAWALTHWKAQGMTLRRARVHLTKKTASMAGIGFVAVTRVRHPSHLVFEQDLPDWEHFQEAQWTRPFRARRRFEFKITVKASHTLRKYGFCAADRWSPDEARIADALFAELRKVAAVRRMGLQTDDLDVYLWGTEEVPYVSA